jgi:hypothetical protein
MSRHYPDWLTAFLEYSSFGEAPQRMYFWTGVSVIASALRRNVWFDQGYFRWFPNFYVILVAPPGVVSKSTTASIGMNLLRQVPDVKFGPDAVTPAALAEAFAQSKTGEEIAGIWVPQCSLVFSSSEFGTLYDPQDNLMTNFLIELYDGREGEFSKKTKHSGSDLIESPLMNLLACTTPSWIASNFKEGMISGGLVSRMIFVFADHKEKFNAYPGLNMGRNHRDMDSKLVDDLLTVSNLRGPVTLTPQAFKWGTAWYDAHWKSKIRLFEEERFGGYVARKQAHLHKLAIVLSVSESNSLLVSDEHLQLAATMLSDIEGDFAAVFGQLGRGANSVNADRLIAFIHKQKKVTYKQAYNFMHAYYPSIRDFEPIVLGAIKAGFIRLDNQDGEPWLLADQPIIH